MALGEDDESMEEALDVTADPVAVVALGSVLLSWYLFYLQGDKEQGIFVGLWAPTLLGAASYLKQVNLSERLEQGLSFQ